MIKCGYVQILKCSKLHNIDKYDICKCSEWIFMKLIVIYMYMCAVKWLIAINHIQNKIYCLHNICVYTVYIYYVNI